MSKLRCIRICRDQRIIDAIQYCLSTEEILIYLDSDLIPVFFGNKSLTDIYIMVDEEDYDRAVETLKYYKMWG